MTTNWLYIYIYIYIKKEKRKFLEGLEIKKWFFYKDKINVKVPHCWLSCWWLLSLLLFTAFEAISWLYSLAWTGVTPSSIFVESTASSKMIVDFGAFVEILPGKEGLLHISHIAHERVAKVEDVLNIGDEVEVKVTEIDEKGRVNLSRKVLLPKPEKIEKKEEK